MPVHNLVLNVIVCRRVSPTGELIFRRFSSSLQELDSDQSPSDGCEFQLKLRHLLQGSGLQVRKEENLKS